MHSQHWAVVAASRAWLSVGQILHLLALLFPAGALIPGDLKPTEAAWHQIWVSPIQLFILTLSGWQEEQNVAKNTWGWGPGKGSQLLCMIPATSYGSAVLAKQKSALTLVVKDLNLNFEFGAY